MKQARYGFWRLDLLERMEAAAFRELLAAVAAAEAKRTAVRPGPEAPSGIRSVLRNAVQLSASWLRDVFPDGPAPREAGPVFQARSPLPALRQIRRLWVGQVRALADDGELDVPRRYGGRPVPTEELIVEWILETARLAGQVRAVAGRPGSAPGRQRFRNCAESRAR